MKISSLTTLILTAIMGVMFSTAGRAPQETDPEVLFKAAIEMEEVDGDLEAAIEKYQKIIADNGNNRTLAAKAMLRLGACYEKLGQEEARRVYERLIKEYPDQSREAESARQRLALLAVSAADEKPHFRKIDIPTRMSLRGSGMLSPDGQKLAFISEGSAWVVPVQGKTNSDIAGAPVRLTEPIHAWDASNVSIAWSGNGRWIGFLVAVPKTDDKAEQALYIVPAEGGEPKLAPITWQDWPGDVHTLRYALSGDAETLYFASGAGLEELRVYSISLAGGERQPLTDPITREPAISPDGSRIVFVRMEQHNPNEVHTHQVWISPIRGGSPVLVCEVAGMTWLRSPIWSPDGSMIAFLSSEGQGGNRHRQIWVVPLTGDSQPAASPSKFDLPGQTADLLAGWTQDNKIGVLLPEPRQIALYTVPSVGGKASAPNHEGGLDAELGSGRKNDLF